MKEPINMAITSDQAFYDQEPVGSLAEHETWMREIEFYFNTYSERLNQALEGTSGTVAELGAGSCGLSICLSRLQCIKHIFAVDISNKRMHRMMLHSNAILQGDIIKIKNVQSDFNSKLPFSDALLDAVCFDASLHHSRSLWSLLEECNRVLKSGGLLIAQRESFLSVLRPHTQLSVLLKTPEVAASVSENSYLRSQYEYYLKVHGFSVNFIPRWRNPLKSIFRKFVRNSFCDGTLFCIKN